MSAASESKSSLTAVSIGKRKLKLDEFVSLVFNYSAVLDLNAAAADQLTADSAKRGPEPPIQYADEVFDTTNALPSQAVRAILLLRAQSFLQIRSRVRAPVVKFLLDLLNAGICPLLPAAPADKSKTDVNTVILAALAACYDPATKAACVIVGRGADKEQVQSLAAACAAADITIPKLTNYERSRFLMGVLPAQALHILSTGAARALSRVSEAAAGLACEAIMAYTEPFQVRPCGFCSRGLMLCHFLAQSRESWCDLLASRSVGCFDLSHVLHPPFIHSRSLPRSPPLSDELLRCRASLRHCDRHRRDCAMAG